MSGKFRNRQHNFISECVCRSPQPAFHQQGMGWLYGSVGWGAMQSFVWFWLKQWIRLRYSSVPSIRPDRLQKILAMQQAGDWLVLDARTTAEFNVSCLPGAVLIGDGEEILHSGPLGNTSRERPILVCCAVGVRSAAVVKRLRQRGFRKAVNLEGGLFEWVNQGHQLVHEGLPTTLVHPFNRFWGLLLKPHR